MGLMFCWQGTTEINGSRKKYTLKKKKLYAQMGPELRTPRSRVPEIHSLMSGMINPLGQKSGIKQGQGKKGRSIHVGDSLMSGKDFINIC